MRRNLRNLLILSVAVVVLGVLLYHSRGALAKQGLSWTELENSLRETQIGLVLLAAATNYVCYLIRTQRWIAFSRYLGKLRFRNVLTSTLMGFSAIFLLGRAGEPVRPLLIARKDRLSISGTFGIYVLERIFDAAAAVTLFGLGLVLATTRLAAATSQSTLVAVRSGGVAMLGLLLVIAAFLIYFRLHGARWFERRMAAWHEGHGLRRRIAQMSVGFSQGLQAIRNWRDLLESVGYTVAHWSLVALAFLLVCHSFGGQLARLGLLDQMLLLGITMMGAVIQLPAVGGGAQAATFFALTAFFAIAPGPALAAAIVLWLVNFASVLPAGVPLFIHQGFSMHELWELASESKREEEIAEEEALNQDSGKVRP